MNFELQSVSIWEFGARKDAAGNPHQEDSLFPAHGMSRATDRLFIVCDGMGGHEAGEVASATVVDALVEAIDTDIDRFSTVAFNHALAAAYDALDRIKCGETRKPGTTLALLRLHSAGATIAHIGDSRVYHIRPGETADDTRILHVTSDHSLVNELVRIGELTPEQARTSSQRNVITRAMQPRLAKRPPADIYTTSDIKEGDYFYLCSDGMLEQMTDDDICEVFARNNGDIMHKAATLTEITEYNQDNHTAILVEITKVSGADPRPVTSIVTPEMAREADAVQARMSRRHASAPKSGLNYGIKRGVPLWVWIVLLAAVAFLAVWLFAMKPSADTQVEPLTVKETIIVTEPLGEQVDPVSEESPAVRTPDKESQEARRIENPAPDTRPAVTPQPESVQQPAPSAPKGNSINVRNGDDKKRSITTPDKNAASGQPSEPESEQPPKPTEPQLP